MFIQIKRSNTELLKEIKKLEKMCEEQLGIEE